MEYLKNIWAVLADLSFWLLLGCFVSGLLHVFVSQKWLNRHLGGSGFLSVVKSVFIGVPMPLCSCGVIPAALGLKKQGAGAGASMGFLISTPQTGIDSIFVSASMLSWPFAVFKLVAAFILGIIGGGISNIISGDSSGEDVAVQGDNPNQSRKLYSIYDFAINDLLYMIWRWIVIGVLISAAITTWVPAEAFSDWTSYSLILVLLSVLLISLPLYVCATSSVPIAAALVDAGMPLSAALVFLMAGPATNIATIGAVYKGFGPKHLLNYLLTIILGSLVLAYCFDFLLAGKGLGVMHHHHSESYASYLLLFFFALFLYRDLKNFFKPKFQLDSNLQIETYSFYVGGLSCQGCVKKLSSALLVLDCIENLNVNLDTGLVEMTAKSDLRSKIQESVEKIGFQLKEFIN